MFVWSHIHKICTQIDYSRWCSPVRGCYSCAVDAAEACKKFPNTTVVDYRLNAGEEPCEHVYEVDDRFEVLYCSSPVPVVVPVL
jgi:hypothetical protein